MSNTQANSTSLLKPPPTGVMLPIQARDIFDLNLTDSHKRTLFRLKGLTWQNNWLHTPPATVAELAIACSLGTRQMFDHLRQLKEHGRIRVEVSPPHQIVVILDSRD